MKTLSSFFLALYSCIISINPCLKKRYPPFQKNATQESESAMFRALSTRGGRGYEKLRDEHKESSSDVAFLSEAKLNRAKSMPAAVAAAKIFKSATQKQTSSDHNVSPSAKSLSKQAKKVSKIHPMFSLFDFRSRKKATANPEFSRYIQYLREGGIWNVNSNKPTI